MKQNVTNIRLDTHGENYGSWMSNPIFYVVSGLLAFMAVLIVLSFTAFYLPRSGAVLAASLDGWLLT